MANKSIAQLLPLFGEVTMALADGKIDAEERADLIKHGGPFILALLGSLLKQHSEPQPAPVPDQPVPAPVPTPTPVPADDWTVDEIRGELMFIEGDRNAPDADQPGTAGKIYGKDHVQMVGERAHLNFTPLSRGREVPREIVRTWYMADGHSPQAQPRWFLNGKMQWNSTDEPDHFSLQAYDRASSPNAGWTIVLLLERQAGPGKGTAEAYNSRPAEFNGHYVQGPNPPVTWLTD